MRAGIRVSDSDVAVGLLVRGNSVWLLVRGWPMVRGNFSYLMADGRWSGVTFPI